MSLNIPIISHLATLKIALIDNWVSCYNLTLTIILIVNVIFTYSTLISYLSPFQTHVPLSQVFLTFFASPGLKYKFWHTDSRDYQYIATYFPKTTNYMFAYHYWYTYLRLKTFPWCEKLLRYRNGFINNVGLCLTAVYLMMLLHHPVGLQ
jgi:hypothetical protein